MLLPSAGSLLVVIGGSLDLGRLMALDRVRILGRKAIVCKNECEASGRKLHALERLEAVPEGVLPPLASETRLCLFRLPSFFATLGLSV